MPKIFYWILVSLSVKFTWCNIFCLSFPRFFVKVISIFSLSGKKVTLPNPYSFYISSKKDMIKSILCGLVVIRGYIFISLLSLLTSIIRWEPYHKLACKQNLPRFSWHLISTHATATICPCPIYHHGGWFPVYLSVCPQCPFVRANLP